MAVSEVLHSLPLVSPTSLSSFRLFSLPIHTVFTAHPFPLPCFQPFLTLDINQEKAGHRQLCLCEGSFSSNAFHSRRQHHLFSSGSFSPSYPTLFQPLFFPLVLLPFVSAKFLEPLRYPRGAAVIQNHQQNERKLGGAHLRLAR